LQITFVMREVAMRPRSSVAIDEERVRDFAVRAKHNESRHRHLSLTETPTVLVVGGESSTLANTTELRERLRLSVHHAMAGGAAIELARRYRFDVAIINVRLPDMSGLDLAGALRHEGIHVPWILVGAVDVEMALEAGKLGALRALTTPFDLYAVVTDLIRVSKIRLWPRLPISPLLRQPGNSAERWAHLVLRACDSECDLPTLDAWRRYVAVSYSALTEASRILGVEAHSARDLMRVLRALFRTDGEVCGIEAELQIADCRTRNRLFEHAGIAHPLAQSRMSPHDYLVVQRFIPSKHPALDSIPRMLDLA
jgi:CheY-like chemotaxis protein